MFFFYSETRCRAYCILGPTRCSCVGLNDLYGILILTVSAMKKKFACYRQSEVTSLSCNIFEILPLMPCKWQPAIFWSPSFSIWLLKLQVMYTFCFECQDIVATVLDFPRRKVHKVSDIWNDLQGYTMSSLTVPFIRPRVIWNGLQQANEMTLRSLKVIWIDCVR